MKSTSVCNKSMAVRIQIEFVKQDDFGKACIFHVGVCGLLL